MPCVLSVSRSVSNAADSPDITVSPGALIAAMLSALPKGAIASAAPAESSSTDAMAPVPSAACMISPLWQAIRIASSRERIPADCRAAISPTLWPMTVSGSKSQDFNKATSPVCNAVSAGCAIAVSCNRLSASSRASSSRSDQPAYCRISPSHILRCLAKTGSQAASDMPIRAV